MPDDPTFLAEYEALAAVERVRRASPAIFYEPHQNGQLQFHLAPHKIRCLWPGNRFGKTTAAGTEADHFLRHRSRPGWHRVAKHPQIVFWMVPDLRWWLAMRDQVEEECLTKGFTYNAQNHYYTYPEGDRALIIPSDRNWKYIEGTNPDLVIVEEDIPAVLWRALGMRAFGRRNTRYIIAATAVMGLGWMYTDLYLPWLEHHQQHGLSELEAMQAQTHPKIWAWPRGSIADNPTMTAEKVEDARSLRWGSDKEKLVRDYGGFQNLAGDCIFDPDGLERLRELCREYADDPHPIFSRGSLQISHPHPLPKVWI